MDERHTRVRGAFGASVAELDLSPYIYPTVGMGTFPTVDDIQAATTQLVVQRPAIRVRQIGVSRMGEPLHLLSIGTGSRHALVVAGAHANEPVGFHTVFALARLLSDTPALTAGWTWHFVPVWDPDAARLNRWYTGPLSVRSYYRGFYRPAADRQPGFTFPLSSADHVFDRPLPETWALMHVIEELRPALVLDLHNVEFSGGAWFVTNRRSEGLADGLRSVVARAGLSMVDSTSNSEYVGWESDGPGVLIEPADLAPGPAEHPYGASLSRYLSRETLSITPEVSLWQSRLPQPPPEGPRRGLAQVAAEMHASVDVLTGYLEAVASDLTIRTPFESAAVMQIAWGRIVATRARDWVGEPTAADYVSTIQTLHMFRLRASGQLRRVLATERAAGRESPTIRNVATELNDQFEHWCAAYEVTFTPRPLPIEDLVQIQVNAALLAANHLQTTNP